MSQIPPTDPGPTTKTVSSEPEKETPSSRLHDYLQALAWLVGILVALAVVWAMHATVSVTMPLAAAFFLALSVAPISAAVRRRLPRRFAPVGHLVAMSVVLVCLGIFFLGTVFAAMQIAGEWPKYDDKVQVYWHQANEWMGRTSGDPGEGEGAANNQIGSYVSGIATTVLSSVSSFLAVLVLVIFLCLLMLVETPRWRAKLEEALGPRWRGPMSAALADIADRTRRYIVVRTILGVITAVSYGLWLWIFGLDLIILWMLLAFLFNYVPVIGSIVSGLLPVGFAFLQLDPGVALVLAAGILVIEQVIGNYLDPKMQGQELALSPLVVLFTLTFWSFVWGAGGALLAVPMTVLMVAVFARTPALEPIALMISNMKSHAELQEALHQSDQTLAEGADDWDEWDDEPSEQKA